MWQLLRRRLIAGGQSPLLTGADELRWKRFNILRRWRRLMLKAIAKVRGSRLALRSVRQHIKRWGAWRRRLRRLAIRRNRDRIGLFRLHHVRLLGLWRSSTLAESGLGARMARVGCSPQRLGLSLG